MTRSFVLCWLLGAGCWLALAGCGSAPDGVPAGHAVVDLDKSNEDELLAFYFGSYLGPEGGDPFAAGLLARAGGAVTLDPAVLPPAARDAFAAPAADGHIDWDEAKEAFQATYAAARPFPPTLDAFQAQTPYLADTAAWFSVELDGVMTTARRRLYVPLDALRAALADYGANGEQIIYPVGTVLVGEHWLEGVRAEVTVKQKRPDGFWDFLVYGADGALTDGTTTPPRDLAAPTQCVGCHLGTKLYEPEKSFPAAAPDGPHGPRAIYVAGGLRDAAATREVTARFQEHRRRPDSVLGIYATLYVARLLADRRAGTPLTPEDETVLSALGY